MPRHQNSAQRTNWIVPEGKNDREADTVAIIRTAILVSYMVTNVAIVANAVRHWNDVPNQNQSLVPKIAEKKFAQNFDPGGFS